MSEVVEDKCKFVIKNLLNFVPNLIMMGIGIFLQVLAYIIDDLSGGEIFMFCLFYFTHILVFIPFCNK